MTAESTDSNSQADSVTANGAANGSPLAGEWVSRAEAVVRLGISQRTVDRKLAQGLLSKRFRSDGSVEVLVPVRETVAAKMADTDQAERSLVVLERFNDALTRQTLPLVAQIRELSEEVGSLRKENEQLRRRNDELERGEQKPWWRFWRAD